MRPSLAIGILEVNFYELGASPQCLYIMVTASSTEAYFKEQRALDIPSLTLLPAGVDRSTINLTAVYWS